MVICRSLQQKQYFGIGWRRPTHMGTHVLRQNYAAGMQGDRLAFTQLDMKAVGNNMNYGTLRIPVMFSMQQNYSDYCCNIGLSVEMRTNGSYRFSPAAGSAAPTVPDALKLNRFGLNFDFSFAYPVSIAEYPWDLHHYTRLQQVPKHTTLSHI